MTDPVAGARALVARPGETVDETDARCIAVRLADEVERLRAIVNAIIPAIGVFDPEDDDQVERIGLEWTTKYHAMARRRTRGISGDKQVTDPVKHTTGYADFLRANDMPVPERLVNDEASEIARLRAELRAAENGWAIETIRVDGLEKKLAALRCDLRASPFSAAEDQIAADLHHIYDSSNFDNPHDSFCEVARHVLARIAAAVAGERERCAAIADKEAQGAVEVLTMDLRRDAGLQAKTWLNTSKGIAHAIRATPAASRAQGTDNAR